jgi:hypothetical protein
MSAAQFLMSPAGVLEPAPAATAPVELSEDDREALFHLVAFLGRIGGVTPLYAKGRPNPMVYLPAGDLGALEARVRRYAGRQLELGLPEAHARNGGPGECAALWAWVESRDQAIRAAGRFKPLPSMVLRMGRSCRRLLLWWLDEPLAHVSVVAANKRIAYALHAPQKYSEPEKLRIPLPGTCLTVGRKRPCPVLVTRLSEAVYTRAQVAGRLKDPPPP